MKKIVFALAAGTTALAAPAMAQNVGPVGPFEGFHVEALGGYDRVEAGSSIDDMPQFDNDEGMDGFSYGVGAGYDLKIGERFVVGPEAEITWSTGDTDFEDGNFGGFGIGDVSASRDIYAGLRAGYIVSPSTMIYAKGGYTNAKFDVNNAFEGTRYERDVDADGWRIGAGVEQAVTNNVFAKVEYRYSNYGRAEIDYGADIPDSSRFDVDFDRHQVMAGVGVRF